MPTFVLPRSVLGALARRPLPVGALTPEAEVPFMRQAFRGPRRPATGWPRGAGPRSTGGLLREHLPRAESGHGQVALARASPPPTIAAGAEGRPWSAGACSPAAGPDFGMCPGR